MKWFRNLSLARKFVATFTFLLVVLSISLLAILFYLARINSYVERHTRITIPAVVTAADMRQALYQLEATLRALGESKIKNERAELAEQARAWQSGLQRALAVYRDSHAARTHPILFGMLIEHGRADLTDQENDTLEQMDALLRTFAFRFDEATTRQAGADWREAADLTRKLSAHATALIDVHTKIDTEMKSEGNSLLDQARLVILALVILLGLVIAATYAMVTTQIARPLSRLASTADRITHQNLSAGFDAWPAKDEVGILARSLSAMLATLQERTLALEQKTRELESFTYSVAHDLKAPLREIEGFSSLLITQRTNAPLGERRPDETMSHYTQMIRSSALRMTAFIDDLLQYSRLERQSIPKSRVDVRTLLSRIMAEMAQATKSSPQIEVDLPFADVWGEPTSIRQALVNLVDNAVKFSRGSDPGHITIGGAIRDGQRVLWISDNGIGFDPKDADKIFGLFERLHGPDEYEGTGAGLAIVKLVMDKHAGRVWAESSPGKGSTFYLSLPEP